MDFASVVFLPRRREGSGDAGGRERPLARRKAREGGGREVGFSLSQRLRCPFPIPLAASGASGPTEIKIRAPPKVNKGIIQCNQSYMA